MGHAAEAIGPYRLLDVLARGDRATVHRAERVGARHRGSVALKVLDSGVDRERVTRLENEARVLAHAPHPFFANVLDFGRDVLGPTYLVTELVHGPSLRRLLRDAGQLQVTRAVSIAVQALAGLNAAHRAGVVHGAIHPEVLLVEPGIQEEVKVIGFGRAQLGGSGAPKGRELPARALSFASPERLDAASWNGLADLWAVAVCLFEALAGVHPFVHGKVPFTSAILALPPHSLRTLRPEVPETLEAVLVRALDKNPAHRYQAADELSRALARYGRPSAARVPVRPPSSVRGGVAKRGEPAPAPAMTPRRVVIAPAARHVIAVDQGGAHVLPSPFPSLKLRTTVLGQPLAPHSIQSAALHLGAMSGVAVTSFGLFHWSVDEGWEQHPAAGAGQVMRGVAVSPAGDGLVFGEHGLAWLVERDGRLRSLGTPESFDAHAACVLGEGRAVLAGTEATARGSRSVLVEVRGDDVQVRPVGASARFSAVAASGDAFIACGAAGLFAVLHLGLASATVSGAYDWQGIAVDAEGAGVLVGKRGRLLPFVGAEGPPAEAPVTLAWNGDLRCASFAGDVLWIGGDRAILRRDGGGSWSWAPVDAPVAAILAEGDRACLLFDDGAVHEVSVE